MARDGSAGGSGPLCGPRPSPHPKSSSCFWPPSAWLSTERWHDPESPSGRGAPCLQRQLAPRGAEPPPGSRLQFQCDLLTQGHLSVNDPKNPRPACLSGHQGSNEYFPILKINTDALSGGTVGLESTATRRPACQGGEDARPTHSPGAPRCARVTASSRTRAEGSARVPCPPSRPRQTPDGTNVKP